jgi:hypothetical protein
MLIDKAGRATPPNSTADATSIEIRGQISCRDLTGRLSFIDFYYLLVSGREPTDDQRFLLVLAHLAEGQERPIGILMASDGEAAISRASENRTSSA